MSALKGKFASCPGAAAEEAGIATFQKAAGCSSTASLRSVMACDYTGYGAAAQKYAQCVQSHTSDEKQACPCAATFLSALKSTYASCPGASSEESGVEEFQKAYGC